MARAIDSRSSNIFFSAPPTKAIRRMSFSTGPASGSIQTEDYPRVADVLVRNLPMCYEFKGPRLFVRSSYPLYYDSIVKSLNGMLDYISVTGTPGIGKSVFYIYFFQRFREENPSITIVTASFYGNRRLKRCYVFHPGSMEGKREYSIPQIENCIHLYDGSPDGEPEYQKMVCFTSPNYSWFNNIRKSEYHARMYMPLWDLEELLAANDSLGLGLDLDQVSERYDTFGGVARYCLSKNPSFVYRAESELLDNLNEIDNFETIKKMLKFKSRKANVIHRIFHMVPEYSADSSFAYSFHFRFASEKAVHLFNRACIALDDMNRSTFVRWLKYDSQAKCLVGRLFEAFSIEKLSREYSSDVRPLGTLSPTHKSFTLRIEDGQFVKAPMGAESVDGLFQDKNTVYFFQITTSLSHAVNANGLKFQLKVLGFNKENYRQLDLRLIFVVPESIAKNFKRQKIPVADLGAGMGTNVSRIAGIGQAHASRLARKGILDAKDLQQGIQRDPALAQAYQAKFDSFLEDLSNSELLASLAEIPQYLLVMSGKYW